MKRGTPRHPKVMDLADRLGCDRPSALGYLELLWHFAAEMAPQGDVGRFADKRIEAALDWVGRGKPAGKLIRALVDARWMDLDAKCRILVHDWKDHCDDSTKKKLVRAGLSFHEYTPITARQYVDTVATMLDTQDENGCLPEPLPEPNPSLPPAAGEKKVKRPTSAWFDDLHEAWYLGSYWNHTGKADSRRAFEKRVIAIASERGITYEDASVFLCTEAKADRARFENTDAWKWRKNLHPATWLNGSRWEDASDQANEQQRQFPRMVL